MIPVAPGGSSGCSGAIVRPTVPVAGRGRPAYFAAVGMKCRMKSRCSSVSGISTPRAAATRWRDSVGVSPAEMRRQQAARAERPMPARQWMPTPALLEFGGEGGNEMGESGGVGGQTAVGNGMVVPADSGGGAGALLILQAKFHGFGGFEQGDDVVNAGRSPAGDFIGQPVAGARPGQDGQAAWERGGNPTDGWAHWICMMTENGGEARVGVCRFRRNRRQGRAKSVHRFGQHHTGGGCGRPRELPETGTERQ